MKSNYIRILFLTAILAIVFMSCATTSGPDAFLAQNVPAEERADLLYRQGVEEYKTQLLAQNNLRAIPTVRLYFENALLLDPLNTQAQAYINKVDNFKAASFSKNLAKAQRLEAKKKRTAAEDFELVLAVQRAADINSVDTNLMKVKYASAGTKKAVVQNRIDRLSAIESKILSEKKALALGKLVPQASRTIAEIESIDPGNSKASSTRKNIDNYLNGLAKKDIETAKAKFNEKKYAEAESAILRAERTVSNINPTTSAEIQALKYQIYLRWGNTLYTTKKYNSADEKATIAVSINRTPEALALKTRINKAAQSRDYDADINDIVAGIDAQTARGDIAGAWNAINVTAGRVKKQASKDILESRKTAVTEKMKSVYNDGITAFNDEDYEDAKSKFRAVLKVDAKYEQAQAYLERTNNKLRALSGED